MRLVDSWHIDSVCDHVEAAFRREIPRLLITVPPGSLKSTITSVMGPGWSWTWKPTERIVSASWHEPLAIRDTSKTRRLVMAPWYQRRWPLAMTRDENLKGRYSNDVGGYRIATHVEGGTGERGDVLLIDDPHNAKEAQTESQMNNAIDWFGDTWISRLNDSIDEPGAMITIGQRIHEDDLIGHLIEQGWYQLCLPMESVARGGVHPYAPYPKSVTLDSGRKLQGDLRTRKGQILAPNYISERRLNELKRSMGAHIAAGQLQQMPHAREGDLLKRRDWRYFPPRENAETDEQYVARMPAFTMVLESWDTPLKDNEANDLICGQCWGVLGADRYLLDYLEGHLNYSQARRAVVEMHEWANRLWPNVQHFCLIEKGGYGIDLIRDLKRVITGVKPIPEQGDTLQNKELRAAAAASDLESHNVWLPGYPAPDRSGPHATRCPEMTTTLVAHAAAFPNGRYKDPVDAWSQMINWLRKRGGQTAVGMLPTGQLPGLGGQLVPGVGRAT